MKTTSKPKRLRQDSQCAKIVRELARANGNWVGVHRLMRVSRSINIHSRVDELRRRLGYRIENHTDVSVKPHVSKYRLLRKRGGR